MKKLLFMILCVFFASRVWAGPSITGGGMFYGGELGLNTYMTNAAGPSLLNEAATSTNPTLVPNRADTDSGEGWSAADKLSLIAGGLQAFELDEIGSKAYNFSNGIEIATLSGVSISNATPSVMTKDATIDDNVAVGDVVIVNSGTNATTGVYRVASIVANTSVTLDRNAVTGACTDGNITYRKNDIALLPTDGTNGNILAGFSHQNKPLQLGGTSHTAFTRVTGEDIGIATDVEIDGITYFDGATHLRDTAMIYNDIRLIFGNASDDIVFIRESADANAGMFMGLSGEGSGTRVPVFLFGTSSLLGDDMGTDHAIDFAGTTQTALGIVDNDDDSAVYLSFSADDTPTIAVKGVATKLEVAGINFSVYQWVEEFDEEAATVQFESGLRADEWVTAGTNYAAANVTYTALVGGTLKASCANADNDSVTILGLPNINVSQNPVLEFRVKIDTKETAAFYVGVASAAFVDVNGAFANDVFVVGINSDNGHGFGATQIVAASVDNAAAVDYDDTGVAIVSDTYVKIKFDLTDTEQPRVWINDTEVAAGSITGTVQDAVALSPYIMVQNLAGGAITRFVTIDFCKTWQDRG